MFKRSLGSCLVRWAIAGLLLVSGWAMNVAAAPPTGFALENVLTGIDQPMSIRFLPDGRMLLIQKKGRMRICDVRSTPASSAEYANFADPAHVYGIEFNQERGMLDLAVDPGFPAAPYIYVLYTPAASPDGAKLRVARFTHVENAGGTTSRLDFASEQVVWTDTHGYDSCCHFGGGLDFGPDGNLWITTGDHFQGSYATSLTNAGGKVHRIRKDGTIPPGNPYADGAGPNVDSLFAIGLRNPFRARWDLPTNRFFIAEVGGNTQSTAWEDLHVIDFHSASGRFVDSDFGKTNDNGRYDGINFGWPTAEGMPPYTDFPGANVEAAGKPLFAYKHSGTTAAINGGVVYRGSQFPAEYTGAYFFADSTRDFLRFLKFKPDGTIAANPAPAPIDAKNPDSLSRPFDLAPVGRIVSLEVGPDGALYFVSFSDAGGAYGQPNPAVQGAVRRYVYDGGNSRPNITTFSAAPASGPVPLNVSFSIAATDANGDAMTYTLDPGDGSAVRNGSLAAGQTVAVNHSYTNSGERTATLRVSDGKAESTATATIAAGSPAVITSLTAVNDNPAPPANYFRYGDTYTFSATATSASGAPLGPEAFTWSVAFIRPGNSHPVVGPLTNVTSFNFSIPSQGQGFSGPVFYRCFLTVRDGNAPPASATIDIFPEKALIHFTSVPSGAVVQIDGNTAIPTPFTLDTLINFEHVITVPQTLCTPSGQQKFSAWADGPVTAQRRFLVPPGESALSASYQPDGPCTTGLVLDGLVVHLEADLNVGLQSGNQVATWLDQSGLGNDLQAFGNPQLAAGLTPSGKPALRLDGAGDKLERVHATQALSGLPVGNAERTMFMLVRYPGGSSAWAGASYGTGASNRAFGLLARHPTGELVLQGWGTGNDLVSNVAGIGGGWMVQAGMVSGGSGRLFKNGVQIAQFPHTYNTLVSKLVIGEEIKNLGFIAMDVAALLIYDRALSNEELANVNDYLRKKYLETPAANTPPTISITAPANNLIVEQGQSVTFSATASDAETGNLSASVIWTSNLDGQLGTGASLATSALSVGNHLITARVSDTGSPALQASANINVAVLVTSGGGSVPFPGALVVRLESDAGVATAGTTVSGWADQSGRGNSLAAAGNPQLAGGLTPSGRAALRFDGVGDKLERVHAVQPLSGLPVGNADRTMFMVVRYPGGSSAWAGAAYGTGAANQAFGLLAKHPSGQLVLHGWGAGNDLVSNEQGMGAGWLVQSGVLASGTAVLFKDGAQIAQFSHNYNTVLSKLVIGEEIKGLGFMVMDVAAVLVYNRALTPAERASVDTYLRRKYFDRNQPPAVAITAPAANLTVDQGQSVTFTATASDPEDGNLGTAVRWASNLAGTLGEGASVTTTALGPGTHVVTASVTDSGGQQVSASVTLTVRDGIPLASALVLRLEADDGLGVAGTTVTGWTDLSGRGNSLTGSGDPQLGTTPTGKPAIRFDGVGDKLQRIHASQPLSGLPTGNADRTIFLVSNYRAGATAWAGVSYGSGASNQAFGLVSRAAGGELVLQGWGRGNDLVSNAPGVGAGWLIQSGMLNGGTARLFKDGTQVAQFSHAYNTVLNKLVIGEEISNLGFAVIDVAAVLVYNRALSDSERASIDSYLRNKYLATSQTLLAASSLTAPSEVPGEPLGATLLAMPLAATWEGEAGAAGDAPGPIADGGDPSLALVLEPVGNRLWVRFPELLPTGDYHLHHSASLVDISDPSKRIGSIFAEEIQLMDPFTRLHFSLVVEPEPPVGFFRLFFEPLSPR
jgi:glucose/arabinose dehydrogenase